MQGFFCTGLSSLVHTWGIHLKGPVYVSIFKPLSIVVAAVSSVIFLGDALYSGTYGFRFLLSLLDFNSAKFESIETVRGHEYLMNKDTYTTFFKNLNMCRDLNQSLLQCTFDICVLFQTL